MTWILRDRSVFGGLVPAGRAGQRLGEEVVNEPSHRQTLHLGLVIKTGHQEAIDPRRIVAMLGHFSRCVRVKMNR